MALNARVLRTTVPGVTGNADYTIAGIGTPVAVKVELINARVDDTDSAQLAISRGFWANNGAVRCMVLTSQDAQANTNTYKTCTSKYIAALAAAGTGAIAIGGEFVSTITDGIRINWTSVTGLAHRIQITFYYGSNVSAHVGVFDFADNTGTPNTTLDVTAPGFKPDFLEMLYGGAAFTNDFTTNNGIQVAEGMSIRTSSDTAVQVGLGWSHADNLADSAPCLSPIETHIIRPVVSGGVIPLTSVHEIQVDSYLSNGFRMKDTKGSNPSEVAYLAVRWGGRVQNLDKVTSPVTAPNSVVVNNAKRTTFITALTTIATTVADKVNAQAGQKGWGQADRTNQYAWSQREVDNATTTDNATIGIDGLTLLAQVEDATDGIQANVVFGNSSFSIDYTSVFISGRLQWLMSLEEAFVGSGGGTTAAATGAGSGDITNIYVGSGGGTTAAATGAGTGIFRPNILPAGIASAEAFGTAALQATATVSPSTITSAEAFGTATIQAGTVTLNPTGIASGEAFGTASLAAGEATVSPSGIPSAEAFGTASLQSSPADINPVAIASAEAWGSPTMVASGGALVEPDAIASEEAFGTASMVAGEALVLPSAIDSAEAFGMPSVIAGELLLTPSAIASLEAWGTPSLDSGLAIIPIGIGSAEAFGLASLLGGEAFVNPSGILSGEAFGTPTMVSAGQQEIEPTGIPSAEAWGRPFLRGGFVKVTLKKKIHDALCAAVEHGTFIEVTYDSENCVLDQGQQVQAASIEVNEVSSAYAVEERHGRKFLEDFRQWQWLVIVRFHEEVICELWVREMLEDPICIKRDANEDRQVRLKLLDAQYDHPPRKNPSNGTLARFRFQAELSPR